MARKVSPKSLATLKDINARATKLQKKEGYTTKTIVVKTPNLSRQKAIKLASIQYGFNTKNR